MTDPIYLYPRQPVSGWIQYQFRPIHPGSSAAQHPLHLTGLSGAELVVAVAFVVYLHLRYASHGRPAGELNRWAARDINSTQPPCGSVKVWTT